MQNLFRKTGNGTLLGFAQGSPAHAIVAELVEAGTTSVAFDIHGIEVVQRPTLAEGTIRALSRSTGFRCWVRNGIARFYPTPRVEFGAEGLTVNGRIVRPNASVGYFAYLTAWPEIQEQLAKRFGSWTVGAEQPESD